MKKPKGRIYQICDEFGLVVWPYTRRPHKPTNRVTRAKRTLKALLNQEGEGHLRLVLNLIYSPIRGQSLRELHASTLWAVSDVVLANRDRESLIIEAMDHVDLHQIYNLATVIKVGSYRETMRVLLAAEIHRVLQR